MLLGGWNSSRTVFSYYIERIDLTPELVDFFGWLKADMPAGGSDIKTVHELDVVRAKK
jgi:hypothetical protein